MRIAIICDFFDEALEYQENLLVKYYVKHGHIVTVVTSTFRSVFDYYSDRYDKKRCAESYKHGGAQIIRLPYRYNLLNRVRAFEPIDHVLEAQRPELIFVHDILPNTLDAVRYRKRHPESRIVIGYHADYSNSGRNWLSLKILHGVIRKWILDRARPYCSKIFPVVPAGAVFLHEIYKVPHAEMELLPLGADTDLAEAVCARGEGKALRQALGVPADHTVIFTGGKLTPSKRTELLIEAVMQLANPTLHLVIVGDSSKDDAGYKERLVHLANGSSAIKFVGWLDKVDIYRHLDMADLAVFPASQSILWQQAISMGLPLIAGNWGHQDISYLNTQDNIIILQRHEISIDGLMHVLRDLLARPERMQQMSSGARKVADERLNWNKLIQKTLRFNQNAADAQECDARHHADQCTRNLPSAVKNR